jgi:hypothetical protein
MTAAAHAQSEDRAVSDPSDDASESVSGDGPPAERRGRFEGYGSIRPIQPASLNRAAERRMAANFPAADDPAAVIDMMYGPLSGWTHPSFTAFQVAPSLAPMECGHTSCARSVRRPYLYC